jgi:hypothetical protein
MDTKDPTGPTSGGGCRRKNDEEPEKIYGAALAVLSGGGIKRL